MSLDTKQINVILQIFCNQILPCRVLLLFIYIFHDNIHFSGKVHDKHFHFNFIFMNNEDDSEMQKKLKKK
jgi:hypothetical protein